MAIDVGSLLQDMLTAATGVAGNHWPKIRDSLTPQFQQLAEIGADIEIKHLAGKLDDDEATTAVAMAKNAAEAIALGAKGQAKVAAQAAVNAALGVLTTAVNSAIGFALL